MPARPSEARGRPSAWPLRQLAFAVLLASAGGLVVWGIMMLSVPVGVIVGGIVLAGWSWLILAEVRE